MSARRATLFPSLTTSYLRSLGELLICASRLQKAIESSGPESARWRERADELVDVALRVADAAAASRARGTVRVTLRDGTAVIADLDFLDGLVRKMHRHHSLCVLQTAVAEEQLVAS